MPKVFIIGGCNGAGKTTSAMTPLPEILHCDEFVNADEIARGISPLNPEDVAFKAGRIMLQRIRELASNDRVFAFETTLATRSYAPLLRDLRQKGYSSALVFFYLNDVELAIARVAKRVALGGHSIPENVIRRRYERGLRNFLNIYIPLADLWIVYDNSGDHPELVATGSKGIEQKVLKEYIWNNIQRKAK